MTPFSGSQFAQLYNDAFSEFSTGVAGLHVNGQTINSEKPSSASSSIPSSSSMAGC